MNNRVFVLYDTDNKANLILSYNIEVDEQISFDQVLFNTIRVHRKKDTNTLYSLNALNEIVKLQNNGQLDKSFIIDWTLYRNCIVTVKDGKLKQINTKLEQIITL